MNTEDIQCGKWRILIPQNPSPVFRCAVCDFYGILSSYLPYPPAVSYEESYDIREFSGENLVLLGTADSGKMLSGLINQGMLEAETHKEGYSVKITASPYREGRELLLLYGADEAGLLHAVHALDREFIRPVLRYRSTNRRFEPFCEPCGAWEKRSFPKIDNRGIWTWGHKIYDYRKFLRHISELGMNMLTVWNDAVPYNAPELLSEAHRRGIRVFWGYSACWGISGVDPLDPKQQEDWCRQVVDNYLTQYQPLGGDGVYFQAFTETAETEIGGVPIAELIGRWSDAICAALHKADPALDIQFGIHASSIKEHYEALRALDPDVMITWEDCGGFPYSYSPDTVKDAPAALRYTEELLRLNGEQTRFGAVLKGFTVLDWSHFNHYEKGSAVIGEAPEEYIRARAQYKEYCWQNVRPYWLLQAEEYKAWVQCVSEAGIRETTVTALIEDGVFEADIDLSAALFASLLWDWDADLSKLIPMLSRAGNIYPVQQY